MQQIAARLGKTSGEAAKVEVEEDSQQADVDDDSGSQIDKAIYDELRARRDFGFEQDLGLELEKRNITKEAEVTKIVDAGLDQMPGVSSSTTFLPTPELTPREVRGKGTPHGMGPRFGVGVGVVVASLRPSVRPLRSLREPGSTRGGLFVSVEEMR